MNKAIPVAALGAMGGVIDPVFAGGAPPETQLSEESSSAG